MSMRMTYPTAHSDACEVTRTLADMSITRTPKPSTDLSDAELTERIKGKAFAIWPGHGRTFEVRFIRRTEGLSLSAVLVELGAAKGAPKTMSGYYETEKEALLDVDQQLEYFLEEQEFFEAEEAS